MVPEGAPVAPARVVVLLLLLLGLGLGLGLRGRAKVQLRRLVTPAAVQNDQLILVLWLLGE